MRVPKQRCTRACCLEFVCHGDSGLEGGQLVHVKTRDVAFQMLVDFVCVLPPKQLQTQSCSVGVLHVLVASVQIVYKLYFAFGALLILFYTHLWPNVLVRMQSCYAKIVI